VQTAIEVYLGLGSNRGDRRRTLAAAIAALAGRGVEPLRLSPLYDTDYVGPGGPQAPYLNAVLLARTVLGPLALLDITQAVERELGRAPGTHMQPRTLDIDVLLYGHAPFRHPRLQIPHARLGERRFVLQPLDDLGALAERPDLVACLRRLEPVQKLRPAGQLVREEWRAGIES